MLPSDKIIAFTKSWEKLSLKPYLDDTGTATIGYGNTYYEDGTHVKITDQPITIDRANALFKNIYGKFSADVSRLLKKTLSQNEFDALCDFDYNKGTPRLASSTLLAKINEDPTDPTIADEFRKWVFSKGVKLQGLVDRAENLVSIYFQNTYNNHN